MRFENKVAIVTGGASGIGAATVRAFAEEGAKVVIADMSDTGNTLAADLNARGLSASFIKTDVTSEHDTQEMVKHAIEQFGYVDILFANAGIARDNPATKLSLKDWQKTIDINLTGVFLSARQFLQQLQQQNSGGALVLCGSIHSFVGRAGVTAYAAAKGGVKLLTQTLAIDYAGSGIRINAICPGYIDTPLLKEASDEAKHYLASLHPQGRLGQPEEVARAVLFLASEDASFINGTSLLVDGGYTAQ